MILYFGILISASILANLAQWTRRSEQSKLLGAKHNRRHTTSFILLSLSFIVLFLFSAIRYEVAIDYNSYMDIFQRIKMGWPVHTEIGFNYFTKLILFFTDDYRWIIAALSLLTLVPVYKAIAIKSQDWGLSVFLFIAFGYYFYTYQNIRQYLAYMMSVYALCQLIDKQYKKFIALAVIGALFHKSCLIILPAYLISQLRFNRVIKLIFWCSGPVIIRIRTVLRRVIFLIYPGYEGSIYDQVYISYKNLLVCFCFYALIHLCTYRKQETREIIILDNLCMFSTYLYVFCWWIPELSRIAFFLLIPVNILFPNVLFCFKNRQQRTLIKICVYVGGILLFYVLMLDAYNPNLRLLPYKTWMTFW